MKVVCDRSALLDALTLAAGIVPSRAANPALQCVRLAAADGRLAVSATDQEISLRLVLGQVNVEEDGEALVPADKLVQIVRASDDGTLTLETNKNAMDIRGADAHFRIFGFDPREAPAVREPKGLEPQGEIPAGLLRRLVSRTVFAASVEQLRYAIAGVLFDRQGRKLRLVATDGKRLAVARGECGTAGDGEHRMIIPNKAMHALLRLVDDPDESVRITADANQARFEVGSGDEMSTLTTNLVEGTFPPFEDVIPKDNDKRISIDADELTSAVRRAALLTTQESRGVRMSFASDGLTLSSRAPEMGEAEIHIDLPDYQGETIDIAFNPGYLVDALKVLDGGPVIVELKTSSKPGVLRAGTDFTYVFMPITLE